MEKFEFSPVKYRTQQAAKVHKTALRPKEEVKEMGKQTEIANADGSMPMNMKARRIYSPE